jgi:hypothetical protein
MEFSELVKRFAAAAAAGNGDALADLFTADGTYDDYFFGPCSGREAIKEMLAHFAEGGRNFRWEFFDPVKPEMSAMPAIFVPTTRPETARALDGIGRFDLEAAASGATRRCSTAAWRWRSRRSSRSGCARSRSSMRRPSRRGPNGLGM